MQGRETPVRSQDGREGEGALGQGIVSRIVRYPVKGLAGVTAEGPVALVPGRGLRWDRSHAIENGVLAPRTRTGWNPRETYFHVAKHEQILRLTTALDEAEGDDPVLTIARPDGRTARTHLGVDRFDPGAADALLVEALPAGPLGPPALIRTGAGLWDWPQAHLSLINLATLDAMADAAGEPMDLRRFRANLYLADLPAWGELALLGRRVRIGDAILEIFQPTDRCRATTINPAAAVSDLNVPAVLASRFGHMFCGVYARVVAPGSIRPGSRLELLGDDAAPLKSRPGWPRRATVVERVRESPSVTSFWLQDGLGIAPAALPGQHIRVHLPGAEAPGWRCYTISGVDAGRFRISVKRDGRISSLLHDAFAPGRDLVITGPFGDVTLDREAGSDVLLLSAGVGITPMIAMLRALNRSGQRIRAIHVERSGGDLSLWHEMRDACAGLADAEAQLFLSRESPDVASTLGAVAGRPSRGHLAAVLADLDPANVAAYACGPGTFTADLQVTLESLGLPAGRLAAEVFYSPSAAALAPPRVPSSRGPHRIRFGTDDVVWMPASGAILDAVEASGADWPSGCRVGACGTCAQRLRRGSVEYLSDPLIHPPPGTVLVCCAAPTSDAEFDGQG